MNYWKRGGGREWRKEGVEDVVVLFVFVVVVLFCCCLLCPCVCVQAHVGKIKQKSKNIPPAPVNPGEESYRRIREESIRCCTPACTPDTDSRARAACTPP